MLFSLRRRIFYRDDRCDGRTAVGMVYDLLTGVNVDVFIGMPCSAGKYPPPCTQTLSEVRGGPGYLQILRSFVLGYLVGGCGGGGSLTGRG